MIGTMSGRKKTLSGTKLAGEKKQDAGTIVRFFRFGANLKTQRVKKKSQNKQQVENDRRGEFFFYY